VRDDHIRSNSGLGLALVILKAEKSPNFVAQESI
jgi:hypothetical protein